jgi:hypothetical protein
LATSDFIAFLDADDEWMPRHLETILGLIKDYPDAGMYTTAYKILTSDGRHNGRIIKISQILSGKDYFRIISNP